MAEAVTIAPVETPVRDWLRSLNVAGTVGDSVFCGGLPRGHDLTVDGDAIVVQRVAGVNDGPIDQPTIQFNIWSKSGAQTEVIEAALRTLLLSTPEGTVLAGTTRFHGAAGINSFWAPAPDTDHPRRIVTATLSIITT